MNQQAVGIVVYVEPKVFSVRSIGCLEKINAVPIIKYLFERLQSAFPGEGFQYYVLHHNDVAKEEITSLFRDTNVESFTPDSSDFLNGLKNFCDSRPHLKRLIIFPEHAIFPDCDSIGRMLAFHVNEEAGVTLAPEYPVGLVPAIFETDAVVSLIKYRLDNRSYLNLLARLQPSDQTSSENQQVVVSYFGSHLTSDLLLENLPAQMLVVDKQTRMAAERVIERFGRDMLSDASAAYAFKKELLAIEVEADIDFSHSPVLSDAPRILFSSIQRFFSGGEESLFLLISNLDQARHDAVAVFRTKTVLAEKLAALGIPVEIADFDFTVTTPYNLTYCKRLLETYRIDLLHVDGLPNPALMTEAYYQQIPIIYHARNLSPPLSIVKLATKIIAISDTVASNLLRRDIDPTKIVRIYNGVDLKLFDSSAFDKDQLREAAGLDQNSFVICMVGRVTPEKNQDLMIRALPGILEKVPEAFVVFVGEAYSADAGYQNSLNALAAQLKVNQHVRFWGFEINIASIYAMSDVLVLSTFEEAFGRCIIEAMGMGLPVVVPNRAGPAEIVRHQEDGILYDITNSSELTDNLVRLGLDPYLRSRLGSNARSRASEFDVTVHAKQVQEVYSLLLRGCN